MITDELAKEHIIPLLLKKNETYHFGAPWHPDSNSTPLRASSPGQSKGGVNRDVSARAQAQVEQAIAEENCTQTDLRARCSRLSWSLQPAASLDSLIWIRGGWYWTLATIGLRCAWTNSDFGVRHSSNAPCCRGRFGTPRLRPARRGKMAQESGGTENIICRFWDTRFRAQNMDSCEKKRNHSWSNKTWQPDT